MASTTSTLRSKWSTGNTCVQVGVLQLRHCQGCGSICLHTWRSRHLQKVRAACLLLASSFSTSSHRLALRCTYTNPTGTSRALILQMSHGSSRLGKRLCITCSIATIVVTLTYARGSQPTSSSTTYCHPRRSQGASFPNSRNSSTTSIVAGS